VEIIELCHLCRINLAPVHHELQQLFVLVLEATFRLEALGGQADPYGRWNAHERISGRQGQEKNHSLHDTLEATDLFLPLQHLHLHLQLVPRRRRLILLHSEATSLLCQVLHLFVNSIELRL
jgi:hypothetical protein